MGAFTMTYLYIGIIITTHIFEISRSHIDLFSNFTEESFYIMFKNRILESWLSSPVIRWLLCTEQKTLISIGNRAPKTEAVSSIWRIDRMIISFMHVFTNGLLEKKSEGVSGKGGTCSTIARTLTSSKV